MGWPSICLGARVVESRPQQIKSGSSLQSKGNSASNLTLAACERVPTDSLWRQRTCANAKQRLLELYAYRNQTRSGKENKKKTSCPTRQACQEQQQINRVTPIIPNPISPLQPTVASQLSLTSTVRSQRCTWHLQIADTFTQRAQCPLLSRILRRRESLKTG